MPGDPAAVAQIEAQIKERPAHLQEAAHRLRALVRELVPEAIETLNPWGMPTFDYCGPLVYYSFATNHITFGFSRGAALDDPHKLLEGTGKNLRHMKLRRASDLDRAGVREIILAVAALNRREPLTPGGRRKKA